jgi:hypothetical protein
MTFDEKLNLRRWVVDLLLNIVENGQNNTRDQKTMLARLVSYESGDAGPSTRRRRSSMHAFMTESPTSQLSRPFASSGTGETGASATERRAKDAQANDVVPLTIDSAASDPSVQCVADLSEGFVRSGHRRLVFERLGDFLGARCQRNELLTMLQRHKAMTNNGCKRPHSQFSSFHGLGSLAELAASGPSWLLSFLDPQDPASRVVANLAVPKLAPRRRLLDQKYMQHLIALMVTEWMSCASRLWSEKQTQARALRRRSTVSNARGTDRLEEQRNPQEVPGAVDMPTVLSQVSLEAMMSVVSVDFVKKFFNECL